MAVKVLSLNNFSTGQFLIKENFSNHTLSQELKTSAFLPFKIQRKGEGGLRKKGYFKYSYEIDKQGSWYACNFLGDRLFEVFPSKNLKLNSFPNQIQSSFKLPLITIITVVLNAASYLEETIQSVISQSYPNIEYIIIDGGSNDETLEIIKRYEDYIDYWVSEPDKGIYDAMNKGIDLSFGQWINFMNAGDSFYDNDVINKVFFNKAWSHDVSVIYGHTLIIYEDGSKKILRSRKNSKHDTHHKFYHQSSFVRSAILKQKKFSLKYKIVSDKEFFIKLYHEGKRFEFFDTVVSRYRLCGRSHRNFYYALYETFDIVRKYSKIKALFFLLSHWKGMILHFMPKKIRIWVSRRWGAKEIR